MRIEKSNNPAAVGALVLVLALIVGKILWMVFGHSGPVAAASTVSAGSWAPSAPPAPVTKASPAAAATPTSKAGRISSVVAPVTTRNPFSVTLRPALAVTRLNGLPYHHDAARRATTGAKAVLLTSLPPLPVRVLEFGLGAGAKPSPTPHGLAALPPHQIAAKERTEVLPTLKLTATVGGAEPLAVVQTADPQPVVLHVGDALEGMRVVAIYEQEVVFARGKGFWTLPLQSAATIAAGSVSVTSVPTASHPVISVAAPEEKIDELQ